MVLKCGVTFQEVHEIRTKRQQEISCVSVEVENRYQVKLQQQLQAMRDEFDARIANHRDELEALNANKLMDNDSEIARLRETSEFSL